MLNPGAILDAAVSMYRGVPELVTALGGADRIYAFVDRYPSDGFTLFLTDKVAPGDMMIVWNGSHRVQSNSGRTLRLHNMAAIWRPGKLSGTASATDVYAVIPLLQHGIPTGKSVGPLYFGILDACDPMPPHDIERKSILINERGATVDYFDSRFTIAEIGDPQ